MDYDLSPTMETGNGAQEVVMMLLRISEFLTEEQQKNLTQIYLY